MNNSRLDSTGNPDSNAAKDLFGMELAYNTAFPNGVSTGNAQQYNGIFHQWNGVRIWDWTRWKMLPITTRTIRSTIKTADYKKNLGSSWSTPAEFSESGYYYDLNGNIKKLQRKSAAGTTMDNLTYTYTAISSSVLPMQAM